MPALLEVKKGGPAGLLKAFECDDTKIEKFLSREISYSKRPAGPE
jgi:hypothetical protein